MSHLVALSGFHLGILWGLVYGVLLFGYRPWQQKFFPYRHALFDVGLVAMTVLGLYVWLVDFPPSLLRSYAMVLVGWVVLLLGMELLSFTFLSSIVLSLVLLFPSLLVSLSFWLSVSGVFYIFLLLQYSKNFHALVVTVWMTFGIFVLMLPVVHGIFEVTSLYQLLSPFLSLAFIVFYPLVMLLHLVGYGDMLDTLLLGLFALPQESYEVGFPLWMLVPYIMLSLGAIFSKKLWVLLLLSAGLYTFYLFALVE
ncbi:MAG: ComEC/Rec2 family competence protein [Sulfurovum sp.]|nr:ComEC/Rec2 family competence protein [Sulfurovum sp.]